jgi:xylan 1,4-beta-xylosidase
MKKFPHVLLSLLLAVGAQATLPVQTTFTGTKSERIWPIAELNAELPVDWSPYKFLVIEFKASSSQRLDLGFETPNGRYAKRIGPFAGVWVRAAIPLRFYRQPASDGADLAATFNQPRNSYWINIHTGNSGPLTNVTALTVKMDHPVGAPTLEIRSVTLLTNDPSEGEFPVNVRVDASVAKGALTPIWRFFGYDEPNYTYMKDGKKLLSELGQFGGPQVFVRCHHLMTSGDGSPALKWGSTGIYNEDLTGKPIYNWTIVDRIFDTYLQRGLKPYVQIGFMPEALSTHPQDYPHNPPPKERAPANAGQAWPPKDYAKWGELIYQWTKHCVKKYGRSKVEKWYWEVWNEPNISYWRGTPQEYYQLYDYAVEGVLRALPTAQVGGPETADGPGGEFLREFLEHCSHGTNYATGKPGSPLDFISFHAKGSPTFTNDHVQMNMSSQLRNIRDAFAVIASFPEYKKTPIIIGESDPEGCAACTGLKNGYRNGTMYSSYTAASFPRKYELADQYGVSFEGALTWAFEFEDQPYFAGFRVLASNGIDLPVLNVFPNVFQNERPAACR